MTISTSTEPDPEIVAISEVYAALVGLEPEAQARILQFVTAKLKVPVAAAPVNQIANEAMSEDLHHGTSVSEHPDIRDEVDEELEGISPAGRRWMTRSGLQSSQLSLIFSIGGDEIDLIAKKVPGASKTQRQRSVFLLKLLASYLATGAARLTFQDAKETCLHYDAFDSSNFSTYLKGMASEVSGSKETGYTLSARGMSSATEMVKSMLPTT